MTPLWNFPSSLPPIKLSLCKQLAAHWSALYMLEFHSDLFPLKVCIYQQSIQKWDLPSWSYPFLSRHEFFPLVNSNLFGCRCTVIFLCNYIISGNSFHRLYYKAPVVLVQIKGNSISIVLFLQTASIPMISIHLQNNQQVSLTMIPN